MKTTIDIPERMLQEAMRFSQAKTKREAIVAAVADYNRRKRMALLSRHLGTCDNLISPADLEKMRETE